MPEFPASPVPPAELLEGFLPAAFEALPPPPGTESLRVSLGVRLEGAGGGEWVVELEEGRVGVRAGSRDETAFSYVQSVDDWQGAIWEGRGSFLGRGAAALFRPDGDEAQTAMGFVGAALPMALEALREVRGLLRVDVTGPDGDWRIAVQLGPGAIPDEPTAVVTVTGEDIEEMIAGRLAPLEAFMAGRIRVTGDMTLLLQIQAAQMQASGDLAGGPGGKASS
jgi:hypothetical protein